MSLPTLIRVCRVWHSVLSLVSWQLIDVVEILILSSMFMHVHFVVHWCVNMLVSVIVERMPPPTMLRVMPSSTPTAAKVMWSAPSLPVQQHPNARPFTYQFEVRPWAYLPSVIAQSYSKRAMFSGPNPFAGNTYRAEPRQKCAFSCTQCVFFSIFLRQTHAGPLQ